MRPALDRPILRLLAVKPPRLRIYDAENGEPRHATWLELFYDLVFVVAVSQLAHKLSGHLWHVAPAGRGRWCDHPDRHWGSHPRHLSETCTLRLIADC